MQPTELISFFTSFQSAGLVIHAFVRLEIVLARAMPSRSRAFCRDPKDRTGRSHPMTGGQRMIPQAYPVYPLASSWLRSGNFKRRTRICFWTIFVILLVLWALGLVTAYTMGGLIHALLVIALIVLVIQVLQGRRVV